MSGKYERLKRQKARSKYQWLDLYSKWIELVDERCRRHLGHSIYGSWRTGAAVRYSAKALPVSPLEDPLLDVEGAPPVPEVVRDPVKMDERPHPGFASDEGEPLGTDIMQIMQGLEHLDPWLEMPVLGEE